MRSILILCFLGATLAFATRALVTADEPPKPAPPPIPGGPGAAPGAPVTLAPLGDGSAVYSDGTGRFFVLRPSPEGLTLGAVYVLRYSRTRHEREPARRAAHGFYLDDLGAEAEQRLERAKE